MKQIQKSDSERQFVSRRDFDSFRERGVTALEFVSVLIFLYSAHLESKPQRYMLNNLRRVQVESSFHSNRLRVVKAARWDNVKECKKQFFIHVSHAYAYLTADIYHYHQDKEFSHVKDIIRGYEASKTKQ